MLSSSAYHCLRSSELPSERNLRDYTHFFKSKAGFQKEVDEMLQNEAQIHTAERKKYVALLFDEMKVKESLVYDKYSAEVIGFVDLDTIDDQLDELAKHPNKQQMPPIATHSSYNGKGDIHRPQISVRTLCYDISERRPIIHNSLGSNRSPREKWIQGHCHNSRWSNIQ